MEFLGVGPTELLFIIAIALIVLGPKDMAKTGSTIGKWLNNIIQSDTWKAVVKSSDALRRMPTKWMLEDNLNKFLAEEEKKQQQAAVSSRAGHAPVPADENTIHTSRGAVARPAKKLKSAATPRKKTTTAKKKAVKSAPRKKPNA